MAEDKAGEAYAKASLAEKLFERIEEGTARAKEAVSQTELKVRIAERSVDEMQAQVKEASTSLADLHRQKEELQRNLGVFDKSDWHFLATLRLVDKYRRILFISNDPGRKEQAEWTLLEKTRTASPLIRRESVLALAGIKDPSDAIVERFEEITTEEDDPEVKELAVRALKTWKSARRKTQAPA